jgi:hypothetical protein
MRSARVFCFLAVAILLCLPVDKAYSKDGPDATGFSGVVVDKAEGVPISYAHVWIHEQSGKSVFTTQPDRTGNFSVPLPDGYYDVLVGAPGFAPFCKKIWIKSGSPIKLKVSLGPDEDNAQVD